eukprot:TRINITY_DN61_c0_g1_i2.p3 TRINITY_DN61_c0_g1~~TRINITY_DN61_c0_g1_i2.p3  ORF type:complete len:164 (-),score=28.12 TRINITY_DN61_c0_g1_i2:541-1032(-)
MQHTLLHKTCKTHKMQLFTLAQVPEPSPSLPQGRLQEQLQQGRLQHNAASCSTLQQPTLPVPWHILACAAPNWSWPASHCSLFMSSAPPSPGTRSSQEQLQHVAACCSKLQQPVSRSPGTFFHLLDEKKKPRLWGTSAAKDKQPDSMCYQLTTAQLELWRNTA